MKSYGPFVRFDRAAAGEIGISVSEETITKVVKALKAHLGKNTWEVPMQASKVHDYARLLLRLHGDKARVVAAQKCVESERRSNHQEAEDWRRIRDAITEMRGPHVS